METVQQNGLFTLFLVNSTLIYILISLVRMQKGECNMEGGGGVKEKDDNLGSALDMCKSRFKGFKHVLYVLY